MNTTQEHGVLPAPAHRPFRILQAGDFHSDQDEFLNQRTRHDMRAFIEVWGSGSYRGGRRYLVRR
jgi:hypothetical protein